MALKHTAEGLTGVLKYKAVMCLPEKTHVRIASFRDAGCEFNVSEPTVSIK